MPLASDRIKRITVRPKGEDPNLMNTIFGVGMRRLIADAASKFGVRGHVSNIYGRSTSPSRVEFIFEDRELSIANELKIAIQESLDSDKYDLLKNNEKSQIMISLENCAFDENDFSNPPQIFLENDIKETAWKLDGANRLFDAQDLRRRKVSLRQLRTILNKFSEAGDDKPFEKLREMKDDLQGIVDNVETGLDGYVSGVNELLGLLKDTTPKRDENIRTKISVLMELIEKELSE